MAGILSGFGGGSSRNIVIRFIADTARASRGIDSLMRKFERARTGVTAGDTDALRKNGFGGVFGRPMYAFLDALTKGSESLGSFVLKLGAAGLAVGTFIGAMRAAFRHGTFLEGAKIIFETLLGNEARAAYMIKEARKYSVLTPFKPEEVVGAATVATQYGIDPFKKGAYGLSKNKNAMDIFAGLGSMMGTLGYGGRSGALGIERMTMAVLRGDYRLLRPVRGIVNPAFEKAKATGALVGTPAFNQKFIKELGKIPAIMELAQKRSESVAGLWSTIAGLGQEFWMDFTGAGENKGVLTFWSQIRDILLEIRDSALDLYESSQPFIRDFGAMFGSVFYYVWTLIKGVIEFMTPLYKLHINVLRPIYTLIRETFIIGSKLLNIITRFAGFGNWVNAFKGLIDVLQEFTAGLQASFVILNAWIDGIFNKINDFKSLFSFGNKTDIIEIIKNPVPTTATPWKELNRINKKPVSPNPSNKSKPENKRGDIINNVNVYGQAEQYLYNITGEELG